MTRLRAAAACTSIALACSSGPTSPGPVAPVPAARFLSFQSARLAFRYTSIDASTIAQTASLVEAEIDRIPDDLGVTEMPTVTITLYPSIDSLRTAVTPLVGSIPSFASGLVTGADAVHILSPNLIERWAYRDGITSAIHEFAHCVSLRLNPTFGNQPRWLWESVALFEAGQYTDPRGLTYFTSGPLPTFAQLNSFDNTIIYDVGATFGRFIVDTRGWDTFRALIRANGDVSRVLGLSEAAFLNEWSSYVRTFFRVGVADSRPMTLVPATFEIA